MTSDNRCLDFRSEAPPPKTHPDERWLGICTDHRRLFDALQDGWLRPRVPKGGLPLGTGKYAIDPDATRSGNAIPVRLKLAVEKLPELDVFRTGRWMSFSQCVAEASDAALCWPGALPTFAISELVVGTEEERVRLTGLAQSVSNVVLPKAPIVAGLETGNADATTLPCEEGAPKLVIPSELDPIQGAMSMALWAVPRIDPWLDVLVTSLSDDSARLEQLADKVEARWLRFPPWQQPRRLAIDGRQDDLWLAAVKVLRSQPGGGSVGALELAAKIVAAARHDGRSDAMLDEWLDDTSRVLSAESTIKLDHWKKCPVGTAVQLVLTRPDPTRFRTWCKDMPDLPPSLWWSAAMLCGLFHGQRRLDTRFRGSQEQQERIAVFALRASSVQARELDWPSLATGQLRWRRDAAGFKLLWGDVVIAHKSNQVRGEWYATNLEDERIQRKAQVIAKELGWPCVHRQLKLKPGRLSVSGLGNLRAVADELEVEGGSVRIRLPPDALVEDGLDVESFRRLVVVEAGRLRNPPPEPSADAPHSGACGVPGLTYKLDFLSQAEENELVGIIDREGWSDELRRRVQHYGWRYDYGARRVDPTMYKGPLPGWAAAIAERLFREGLVPHMPDQVIVNEYVGNQGISRHVDSRSSFADGIAMVSLLESWEMVFQRGRQKRPLRLDKRSVVVMQGESRYDWTHEIPNRKTEPSADRPGKSKPSRILRERRVSLTFRRVIGVKRRDRERRRHIGRTR